MSNLLQNAIRDRPFYMVDAGLTVSVSLSKNGWSFAAAAGAMGISVKVQ
jgi:hypothetical protein